MLDAASHQPQAPTMVTARNCLRFLPPPPSTQPDAAAAVFFPASGSSPSEDRISQLPEDIQRTIVSKLPVKNGAASVVLSSSWRSIWSSIPLVLDDAQLWPAGADELVDDYVDMGAIEDLSRDMVWAKVTSVLRSHPGPFRSVRLTSSPASSLRAWLRIMAAKGVEDLVILNCEWPKAMMVLSVELLRCESLKRLHVALSQMPHLTVPGRARRRGHRRAVHFPNLEELVLCHAFVPENDIADFLAGSPVLKTLAFIEGCGVPRYIDILCLWLKCLLLWQFKPLKLTVDAPRIERIIMWRTNQFFIPPRTRILIRQAPNLRVLGYLDPKFHVLESGDMVIKVGTRPKPDVMLPSVEILAIKIRFGVREDERMLLSYLRVFPNIRTLHIQSARATPRLANEHGPDFWNNDIFSLITCVEKIKKFTFYDFHGMDNNSELSFIKSIVQTCNLLEHMRITISGSIVETPNLLKARLLNSMSEVEWASEESTLDIITDNHKEWEYKTASDLSLSDPFEYISSP